MGRIILKLHSCCHVKNFIKYSCLLVLLAGGCGSPPSVAPLLRAAGTAVEQEAQRLGEDAQRDQQQIEATRRMLRDAFDADLKQTPNPDAAWVRSAANAYAQALEELVRQEMRVLQERRQRAANLRDALLAQQRAIRLIERQDQLLQQMLGFDLWQIGRAHV